MPAYDNVDDAPDRKLDRQMLKRLLAFVRPYRKWVIISVICSIFSSLFMVARADMTRIGIDTYISVGNLKGLWILCGAYILLLLVQAIMQFGLTYAMAFIGQNIIYDLRVKLFRHTIKQDSAHFDKTPVGEMVSRVTNDVNALSEMFSSGLIMVITDVLILGFITARMFTANWRLALVVFTVLPFLLIASFFFRIKARQAFRAVRKGLGQINSFMQERVSGMALVQIFRREEQDLAKFTEINSELRSAHIQTVLYYALYFPVVELLSTVAIGLILWYGGGQVVLESLNVSAEDQVMTVGALLMFIQLTEMFFRPVFDLSDKYNLLQNAMASSERIFKLLDTSPSIQDDTSSTVTPDACLGELEFKDINFAYNPGEPVLKEFSLKINKGETLAVVGATGAGKTTIISLLSRFYDPQEGQILLDGTPINTIDLDWLRGRISVVLQDVFLFPGTVRDNISLGNTSVSPEAAEKAAHLVGAHDFILALQHGYDTVLGEDGGSLSVGQKQLISFARALAFDPGILVLDEATSSVDTETEHKIQAAIHRMLEGRTSIVIAHRLSTIRNADRIAVMHHGKLRELGSHSELLAEKGLYYKLYQLQYKDQEVSDD
ncbi:antibiotic ABC transporter ATP-binding protein [bacterium F16]|nr:antibiotic ABC transporter ATP-binding protein [bacterium F16]